EAHLVHVALLLEPRQQEIELGLEGGARLVLVEVGEEGIADVLEQLHPFEALAQALDQGGLAHPDGPVDGQVVEGELDGGQAAASLLRNLAVTSAAAGAWQRP